MQDVKVYFARKSNTLTDKQTTKQLKYDKIHEIIHIPNTISRNITQGINPSPSRCTLCSAPVCVGFDHLSSGHRP